jgi:hypothetical protein
MDQDYFRGKVEFNLGVPLAPDPILEFLAAKRGGHGPPAHHITLQQPVAHVVGQFAALVVMAHFGEGPMQFSLSGDRGAIGVDREGKDLAVSIPLDQYAGVAVAPSADVAAAAARACRSLQVLLRDAAPELAQWSFIDFLGREAGILERIGTAGPAAGGPLPEVPFELGSLHESGSSGLRGAAVAAEASGAHVIPLWDVRAAAGSRLLHFDPIRITKESRARGALARLVYPEGERLLTVRCSAAPSIEMQIGQRLRRGTPFLVDLSPDNLRIESVAPSKGQPIA